MIELEICKYCLSNKPAAYYNEMLICGKCYEEKRQNNLKKVEGKEMVKVYEIKMDRECPFDRMVMEEDYLKVVEENVNLNKLVNQLNENNLKYKEELKEEYESVIMLKEHLKDYEERLKEKDQKIEILHNENLEMIQCIEGKQRTIDYLNKHIETVEKEELEETWTLKYIYNVDGVVKDYEQNGMIKEDAEELIGMDSDNWIHYSLTKEERPNKDQVIEGLLIRCESNEELIQELEEKNEKLKISLDNSIKEICERNKELLKQDNLLKEKS
ncbi:hypothetical protein mgb1_006 [Bacillus phage MG-B1]|uniref:Uncharacterized protein n=1 Tax=Bacillus phage MG-B1 TaxID=1309583 RepID=M4W6L5_9CAUD|nr:hypothetical protein mgb1_006 [Bacillus phage MG-B1]AGI10595.1 hypothetical protein mgb1_006 [Bacillus phage MG-B1]